MAGQTTFEEVHRYINETLMPEVRQSIKPKILLSQSDDGRTRDIKLFHAPGGRPHATVTRMANGTIVLKGLPEEAYHNPAVYIDAYVRGSIVAARTKMAALVMKRLRGRFGSPSIDRLIVDKSGLLIKEIRAAAKVLGDAHFTGKRDANGRVSGASPRALATIMRRIMTEQLMDRDLVEFTNRIHFKVGAGCSLYQYNQALLNRSAFQRIFETTPAVLQLYLRYVEPAPEQDGSVSPMPVVVDSPSEIVRLCREATGWSNAQWHYFTAFEKLPHLAHYSADTLADIGLGLELAVAANAPRKGLVVDRRQDHPIVGARVVTAYHNICSTPNQTVDARQGFVNILRAAMGRDVNAMAHSSLGKIVDTFDYHVIHNLPWSKTNLDGYLARSKRYHQMVAQAASAEYDEALNRKEWDSLVPALTIQGLRVEPILDSVALAKTSRIMRNCLRDYSHRCAQGNIRVFTIRDGENGALRGVTAIARGPSLRWNHYQRQLYGKPAAGLKKRILHVVEQVPMLYNRAYSQQLDAGEIAPPIPAGIAA